MSAPSLILHLPHNSTLIPADIREQFALTDRELYTELLAMTDRYTDELFQCSLPHVRSVFPVSRLVVDPERFEDDAKETMAQRGMGVIYTRTSQGLRLRRELSVDERQTLIERYYRPHHAALTSAVDASLAACGTALVVDCHSFAARPLPYEPVQDPVRPEICIGTDPFHTPGGLEELACRLFREAGFSVAVNTPFAGALVPLKYYGKQSSGVHSVMIELNRGLYMNSETGERSTQFPVVKRAVANVLAGLGEWAVSGSI